VGCFRFSQSARLTNAAVTLRRALHSLERYQPSRLMLLGHSVGGLVARRALIADARLPPLHTPMELVTVATPFAGVASARACGEGLLRIASLGVAALVCRARTGGSRWRDIHPRANLIHSPGALGRWVGRHLNVVTWERGRCRVAAASGVCRVSDDVFGTAEQMSPAIADARLITRVLRAGHVAAIQDRRASARLAAMMSDVH